ncbi:MCE family protein [Mycobacterium sp. DL440]|uniref:MCE family protein n=1 Tax=Mycobacterium sp. DL440 TaxID=2675523 RepID=UPI001420D612|nr:MCE family protein [Mycobacterium sp. DL440]
MIGWHPVRTGVAVSTAAVLALSGCAFNGVNSLPLPGAVGNGAGATVYHVEIANVGTLESNSPVMMNDVVVGSVGTMTLRGQHADVEVRLEHGVSVPANVVATVGQTSLLGSQHLALDPPPGQPPLGQIASGSTVALNRSSTYPSTEQTLSSLSAVVNGGGLGQVGDIVHNFNATLSGRQDAIRDLINRLDRFVGVLDRQRGDLIASIDALNRLTGTFAGQREVITETLRRLPPALDVLLAVKPRILTALDKLRAFSSTATALVNDTQADLVRNLQNLQPTIRALADAGPGVIDGLMYATVFPYGQNVIDRGLKGDYLNLFAVADLTVPRMKRGMFLGTRWGVDGAQLVPAPGDPGYDWYYTNNPLGAPLAVPPDGTELPPPSPPVGPPVVLPGGPVTPAAASPSRAPLDSPPTLPPAEQGGN